MKNTKKNIIIATFFIIIGSSAYSWMFYNLMLNAEEVSLLSSRVLSSRDEEKNVSNLSKLINDTSEERILIDEFFVEEDAIVELISSLELIGIKHSVDVSIDSVDPSKTEASKEIIKELEVNISVKGDIDSILNFVSAITSIRYGIIIHSFNVDYDDTSWNGMINIIVPLTTQKL